MQILWDNNFIVTKILSHKIYFKTVMEIKPIRSFHSKKTKMKTFKFSLFSHFYFFLFRIINSNNF